jgi:putative ATP-dependent endonuclease of OLD family
VRIQKLIVRNFRGFSDLELTLGPTTVLIGENNTGKTSLLDAIRLCLSRPATRRDALLEEYDFHLPDAEADPTKVNIEIDLEFGEDAASEWPDEVVQQLPDVVVLDDAGLRHVRLRLRASYDSSTAEYQTEWEFLDAAGNSMGARIRRNQALSTLQQLVPIYYLTANRDASREFQARSAFWGPFLRNPVIADDVKQALEADLATLNQRVLDAEGRIKSVAEHVARSADFVDLGSGESAEIEAIPLRIRDLLVRAQVVVQGATGIVLPLGRHGTGTQSLAVLFLFEAFLSSLAAQTHGVHSTPVLTLEEPEAHLHPSAIRSLWPTLEKMPGQKIVVSHSGDLLAAVPLTSIRRLFRTKDGIELRQVPQGTFSADEERKINYHVRRTAGELFFARCWLLGEGETEYWVFSEAARILGIDLDRAGVRIVPGYAQISAVPLVRLADALGIHWHCVADGDAAGAKRHAALQPFAAAAGGKDSARLTRLAYDSIEHLLCEKGFGYVYLNHVSPQKGQSITAKPGDADYWPQVLRAQGDESKVEVVMEVMHEMAQKGKASVPAQLAEILEAAVTLAAR